MTVDILRPDLAIARHRRAGFLALSIIAGIVIVTVVIMRIRPAAAAVNADSLWIDTVREGPMAKLVRARGTLVPLDLRFVTAPGEGRVDAVRLTPGTAVGPDAVLIDLSNPDVEHAAAEAQSQLAIAEADLADARARLDMLTMQARADAATVASEAHQAALDAEVQEKLAADGLTSAIVAKKAKTRADELAERSGLARERVAAAQRSLDAQLGAQQTRIAQARALALLQESRRQALHVRAPISGVLEELLVESGQRVVAGTTLAKVADPQRLQAELKVPEGQAREIRAGQAARIDLGGAEVPGHVARVAPAVQNGTVAVDVTFDRAPAGLRPDQSVTGTCEIARLPHAVYIARPAFGDENGTVNLFKVADGGKEAVRVTVHFGAASADSMQVLGGLKPGDRVILSDTSRWDAADRIRLQ